MGARQRKASVALENYWSDTKNVEQVKPAVSQRRASIPQVPNMQLMKQRQRYASQRKSEYTASKTAGLPNISSGDDDAFDTPEPSEQSESIQPTRPKSQNNISQDSRLRSTSSRRKDSARQPSPNVGAGKEAPPRPRSRASTSSTSSQGRQDASVASGRTSSSLPQESRHLSQQRSKRASSRAEDVEDEIAGLPDMSCADDDVLDTSAPPEETKPIQPIETPKSKNNISQDSRSRSTSSQRKDSARLPSLNAVGGKEAPLRRRSRASTSSTSSQGRQDASVASGRTSSSLPQESRHLSQQRSKRASSRVEDTEDEIAGLPDMSCAEDDVLDSSAPPQETEPIQPLETPKSQNRHVSQDFAGPRNEMNIRRQSQNVASSRTTDEISEEPHLVSQEKSEPVTGRAGDVGDLIDFFSELNEEDRQAIDALADAVNESLRFEDEQGPDENLNKSPIRKERIMALFEDACENQREAEQGEMAAAKALRPDATEADDEAPIPRSRSDLVDDTLRSLDSSAGSDMIYYDQHDPWCSTPTLTTQSYQIPSFDSSVRPLMASFVDESSDQFQAEYSTQDPPGKQLLDNLDESGTLNRTWHPTQRQRPQWPQRRYSIDKSLDKLPLDKLTDFINLKLEAELLSKDSQPLSQDASIHDDTQTLSESAIATELVESIQSSDDSGTKQPPRSRDLQSNQQLFDNLDRSGTILYKTWHSGQRQQPQRDQGRYSVGDLEQLSSNHIYDLTNLINHRLEAKKLRKESESSQDSGIYDGTQLLSESALAEALAEFKQAPDSSATRRPSPRRDSTSNQLPNAQPEKGSDDILDQQRKMIRERLAPKSARESTTVPVAGDLTTDEDDGVFESSPAAVPVQEKLAPTEAYARKPIQTKNSIPNQLPEIPQHSDSLGSSKKSIDDKLDHYKNIMNERLATLTARKTPIPLSQPVTTHGDKPMSRKPPVGAPREKEALARSYPVGKRLSNLDSTSNQLPKKSQRAHSIGPSTIQVPESSTARVTVPTKQVHARPGTTKTHLKTDLTPDQLPRTSQRSYSVGRSPNSTDGNLQQFSRDIDTRLAAKKMSKPPMEQRSVYDSTQESEYPSTQEPVEDDQMQTADIVNTLNCSVAELEEDYAGNVKKMAGKISRKMLEEKIEKTLAQASPTAAQSPGASQRDTVSTDSADSRISQDSMQASLQRYPAYKQRVAAMKNLQKRDRRPSVADIEKKRTGYVQQRVEKIERDAAINRSGQALAKPPEETPAAYRQRLVMQENAPRRTRRPSVDQLDKNPGAVKQQADIIAKRIAANRLNQLESIGEDQEEVAGISQQRTKSGTAIPERSGQALPQNTSKRATRYSVSNLETGKVKSLTGLYDELSRVVEEPLPQIPRDGRRSRSSSRSSGRVTSTTPNSENT